MAKMEQEIIKEKHNCEENALIVDNYPYGFKRTKIRYWIETTKNGDRFVSQTLNPKTEEWNKPKKSIYSSVMVLTKDKNTGYINYYSWSPDYTEMKDLEKFLKFCDGYEFNDMQKEKIKIGIAIYKTRKHIEFNVIDTTGEDDLQELVREKQQMETNKKINQIFGYYYKNE